MTLNPKTRLQLLSTAGALLVAAILVAVNVISRYAYIRLDLSEGKIYSLSSASKDLLKRLDDPVYVTAYFSPALPPQYTAARDYLDNLLKEYATYSHGKLRYEFYAASDAEKFREAASKEGIYPVRFNILEKERYEVREAFLGLVIKYQDKKEVLPFLQDVTGLEYDLSGRIKKMMRAKKKVIGVVSSNGAQTLSDIPEGVVAKFEESYDHKSIDLAEVSSETIAGIDALLMLGPVQRLDDRAVFGLDQIMLSGKPVAMALDTKRIDLRNFMGAPLDLGLDGWLRHHGLILEKNLVLDLQNQKVSIQAQQGWMQITNIVDYPPFVVSNKLSPENPVTKGLDSAVLPFVAAVDISTGPGMKVSPMIYSSKRSWMRKDWERQFARLSPFEPMEPTADDARGPFVLAAAVEGKFTSYFPEPPKKTETPREKKDKKEKAESSKLKAESSEPFLKESVGNNRLIFLGTSRFISKDVPLPESNAALFLNLADWLGQDPEMAAIRTKSVAFRPLREIAPEAKMAVRYANLFAGPVFIVGVGLVRWRRRRTRTARRVDLYRP